ncbi:MAG: 1-(5-phosphoribosyl)-5-amino-4-imidazole-carboxylate carboxylase, partial [Candidatus Thorarchaeota archaeon]|nr:1-(5-phosphoribosyl)-5-amino-4-imidazole-carboxylate carboxylase [Candidatus Thorarchaeota archaeon]
MNRTRKLLDELVSGKITVDEAEKQLKTLTLDSISGLAMIDVDRESRSGIPEIVFGESKDAKEIVQIVRGMLKNQDAVLVTRLTQEKLDFLV